MLAGEHARAELVGEAAAAHAPRARKAQPKAAARDLDRAAGELFDPEPVAEAAQHLFRIRRAAGATTTLEPRGSGGSDGPARRPCPVEPAAAACARSVSGDPSAARVDAA